MWSSFWGPCACAARLWCIIWRGWNNYSTYLFCYHMQSEAYLHLQRPNHNLPRLCLFLSAQPLITKLKINLSQLFHLFLFDHLNYYLRLATNKILPHGRREKSETELSVLSPWQEVVSQENINIHSSHVFQSVCEFANVAAAQWVRFFGFRVFISFYFCLVFQFGFSFQFSFSSTSD